MLPKPIYEIAPFFYAGFGLVSLLLASSIIGALCSGLLISAALLIFKMRYEARMTDWPYVER
jgi:hypothetical protein